MKAATNEDQVAYARTLKVYPLSEAGNPPPTNFIDAYPKKWDTLPKYFQLELSAKSNQALTLATSLNRSGGVNLLEKKIL